MPRQYTRTNPVERFWNKVDKTVFCWLWTGARSNGYGHFAVTKRRHTQAHIYLYELAYGPRPAVEGERITLDHLCRNRACVRPDHLEPVSNRENILRGVNFAARYAAATHCKNGHEFTPENTGIRKRPEGGRVCLACRVVNNQRVTEKRRAGILPYPR